MMRGHRFIVPRILATTSATLIVAVSVSAALPPLVVGADTAACSDGGTVNRHKGYYLSVAGADGATAYVDHQTLHQCTPTGPEISGSFAFVNVQGPGGNDMVQAGFGECRTPFQCDAGMHAFWAYGRTSTSLGCNGFTNRPPTVMQIGFWGPGTEYKVYHTSNLWRFYFGGENRVSLDEYSICWTPNAASWFGESWDAGDAIGGTSADHLTFGSMRYATTEGGAFTYTNLNPSAACNLGSGSPYFCDILGPSLIDVWTSR
jgi:hypothetical protein